VCVSACTLDSVLVSIKLLCCVVFAAFCPVAFIPLLFCLNLQNCRINHEGWIFVVEFPDLKMSRADIIKQCDAVVRHE